MSEKPEDDDYDDDLADSGEHLHVDSMLRSLDQHKRKKGSPPGEEPAWRRLEALREQQRTKRLTEDFEDFDLDLDDDAAADDVDDGADPDGDNVDD